MCSLYSNTTASENTAVGAFSLCANTTGAANTALGRDALKSNTTGSYNTAMSLEALLNNTTGGCNTSIGHAAGYDATTGNNNLLLGFNAGRSSSPSGTITTQSNIAVYGNNNMTDHYMAGDLRLTTGGLYVGGSAAANKLDDYEEGTFTPVLQGTTNPTVTYTHQVGKYTKVGNKVTVNYYLETTAYTGGSAELRLGGLPFTVASGTYEWSAGSITLYQVAQFNETVARANANTTYLTVWGRDTLTTSGTWSSKNLSDWKTSGTSAAMATVTYFTD